MNQTLEFPHQDDAQVAELASHSATIECTTSKASSSNAVPTAEHFNAHAQGKACEARTGGTTPAGRAHPYITNFAQPGHAANSLEQVVEYPLVLPAAHNTPTAPVEALQGTPYETAKPVSPAHAQALMMASLGHAVFPLHGMKAGTCTCGTPTCPHPGKHPRRQNYFKEATTDSVIINMWFKQEPDLNYGVRLGQEIGNTGKMVLVVDEDRYKIGGAEALEELEKLYGRLPATVEVLTGGGGSHYYFLADCKLKFVGKMGNNIDLKVNGYVVGPGSLHASGRRYCVFHAKWPPVPRQTGHPVHAKLGHSFHAMADSRSVATRGCKFLL